MVRDPRLKTIADVDRALEQCENRRASWRGHGSWGSQIAQTSASSDIRYLNGVKKSLQREARQPRQQSTEYCIATRYNDPTWEVDDDDVKAVIAKYNSTQDISDDESNIVISFVRKRMKEEALGIRKRQYRHGLSRGNSISFEMEAEVGLIDGGYIQKSYRHLGIDFKILDDFNKRSGITICNGLVGEISRFQSDSYQASMIRIEYGRQLKMRVNHFGITLDELNTSKLRENTVESLEDYLTK